MRVLVACEYSGTVRRAFAAVGHDAWSCDLLPSEDRSNRHIVGDARDILDDGWDLLIVAHPPCTRLCNSGVRWLEDPRCACPEEASAEVRAAWQCMTMDQRREVMRGLLADAAALFSAFWCAPIPRVAVENPVMHKHGKALIRDFRPHSQSVQPYEFGHPETKRTCLWLRNLPLLQPTNRVEGREQRIHRMSPGPDRWKERSRFYPGIAAAMAEQWGGLSQLERAA